MLINTEEQFNKIKDGTVGFVVHTGDEWKADIGRSVRVIKTGTRLYEVKNDFFVFEERDDPEYSFDCIFKIN